MTDGRHRLTIWISAFSILGAALAIADGLLIVLGGPTRGQILGRDFVQFWAAARLADTGDVSTIYSLVDFNHYLQSIFPDH